MRVACWHGVLLIKDPVSEDIAEAYRIPTNSFADKCICLVSRSPCFRVLRDALEELFALAFPLVVVANHCGILLHTWSPTYFAYTWERSTYLLLTVACFVWSLLQKMAYLM